jgi:hypothetical protein
MQGKQDGRSLLGKVVSGGVLCGYYSRSAHTVALDHEWFNYIVSDHLEVGVSDPMANGGFRPSEEIVEDGDFVAEKHKSVDEMGSDEPSTARDKNALALRWRKQLDGYEAGEGGVGNGVGIGMENRIGLVDSGFR